MSSAKEDDHVPEGPPSPQTTFESIASIDGDPASGGNLDKVRNILFGAQARDYEKRFSRLEERVAKESSDIRDEMRRRFDALDALVKRDDEALGDRLRAEEAERQRAVKDVAGHLKDTAKSLQDKIKTEHAEREDALGALSTELRDAADAIDRRIGQLDENTTRAQRELREQMVEQGRNQSEQLHSKSEEIWAALAKAVGELRTEKTDRSALAALLTELAMRLNDDFKFPSNE